MGKIGPMATQVVTTQQVVSVEAGAADRTDDAINEADLVLCNALFCCNVMLYPDFPACFGCSVKQEMCCCIEQVCCKLGTDPLLCDTPEGDWCQCGMGCCSLGCRQPRTCCAGQEQICCLVAQFAFPTTDEMPMMCACCCLACYPGFGCYKKLGELTTVQKVTTITTIQQVAPAQNHMAPPPPPAHMHQASIAIPGGSWSGSGRNARMEGNKLIAELRDGGGNYHHAETFVDCYDDTFGNDQGRFCHEHRGCQRIQ